MAKINEIFCNTWHDFKTFVISELFDESLFNKDIYLFRGQGSSEWSLQSSFDRWFECLGNQERDRTFNKLLENFQKECESIDDLSENVLSDKIKLLALAQHHGLPTRLLDWSVSPYVAAFFALIDAVSINELDGEAAIWALDTQNEIWSSESGVEILQVPTVGNKRLRNQQGRFTYARTPFRCLEEYVEHFNNTDVVLIKFVIPLNQAKFAISDLDAMGINHACVFPGLTGCASAAKMRVIFESTII